MKLKRVKSVLLISCEVRVVGEVWADDAYLLLAMPLRDASETRMSLSDGHLPQGVPF